MYDYFFFFALVCMRLSTFSSKFARHYNRHGVSCSEMFMEVKMVATHVIMSTLQS